MYRDPRRVWHAESVYVDLDKFHGCTWLPKKRRRWIYWIAPVIGTTIGAVVYQGCASRAIDDQADVQDR